MKTNLEILIEHLQAEFDYLNSSMNNCANEWDFDGAKAFREPLIYTQRKLEILKCLENPNYKKISRLTSLIFRMEKSLTEKKFEIDYYDEKTRQQMDNRYNESTRKRIEIKKIELQTLQSIIKKQGIDTDEILKLIESLANHEANEIELEIVRDRIYLIIQVIDNAGRLKFMTKGKTNIEHFLVQPTKSILEKLGFNIETFEKQIPNFQQIDKIKILEELAIIYFEVFGIFGEQLSIQNR